MTEIDTGGPPGTHSRIVADLDALGVSKECTLIVHSSLKKLGWVSGGAHAVVAALRETIGDAGTLVMPTHSSEWSDPAGWINPPVPEAWWPVIRAELPAWDPELTPTSHMGAIVECFRHLPGVVRSNHPRHSFGAVGPNANVIVAEHELADGMGERSPLARCYDLDAYVLLLGVGHANNTSLHLAEMRGSFARKRMPNGSAITVDGRREWIAYEEDVIRDEDFTDLGAAFAQTGAQIEGPVLQGTALLMRQRAIVDFGVEWMNANRP